MVKGKSRTRNATASPRRHETYSPKKPNERGKTRVRREKLICPYVKCPTRSSVSNGRRSVHQTLHLHPHAMVAQPSMYIYPKRQLTTTESPTTRLSSSSDSVVNTLLFQMPCAHPSIHELGRAAVRYGNYTSRNEMLLDLTPTAGLS